MSRFVFFSDHLSRSVSKSPPGFIKENIKNKPPWWIARFIKGSFAYSEGLVYPNAMKSVIPAFTIPREWKRLVAFDYGLTDAADYLCAAIDEIHGELHIYKEARTSNRNIEELAKLYYEVTSDIPSGGLLGQPIIDPKSGPKRDYNKKTLGDHFLDFGISFKPGFINIDARVFRLNTYIESNKLKIHDCCLYLIEELKMSREAAHKRTDRIEVFLLSLAHAADYPLCRFVGASSFAHILFR